MKTKRNPVIGFIVLTAMFISLTSCATHPLTPRQEADLQAWQNDTEYDPASGKSFHRGKPRPVEDVLHDQFIQETLRD